MDDRTLLGRRDDSDEVVLGTARGVEFARSFKRRAEHDRWSQEEYRSFIGVPWNPRAPTVEAPAASGGKRYITKALVQEHGETPDCMACLARSSVHTIACRARFEEIFARTAPPQEALPLQPQPAASSSQAEQAAMAPQAESAAQPALRQVGPPPGLEAAPANLKRQSGGEQPEAPAGKRIPSAPVITEVVPMGDAAPAVAGGDNMMLGALCEEEVENPVFDENLFGGSFYDQFTGEILPKELVRWV